MIHWRQGPANTDVNFQVNLLNFLNGLVRLAFLKLHFKICGYQVENFKLANQQYIAWSDWHGSASWTGSILVVKAELFCFQWKLKIPYPLVLDEKFGFLRCSVFLGTLGEELKGKEKKRRKIATNSNVWFSEDSSFLGVWYFEFPLYLLYYSAKCVLIFWSYAVWFGHY